MGSIEGRAALYQHSHFGAGGGGTVALDAPLLRPTFGSKPVAPRHPLFDIDLVTDLGVRIGSRRWLRGAATCAALCCAALSLAPGLSPIAGASGLPLADAQWEEARALAIAPLAYGADTGRRMAATDAVEPLAETPERPRLDLLATLGIGDGFARVLERSGVAGAEASRIAGLVAEVVPLGDIRPGTTLDVTLGRRPNKQVARPLEALSFRARFDLRLDIARAGAGFTLNRIRIAVDETPLRIQGQVGSSLYRSARAAGAPAKAVEAYIRAVAAQVPIGGLGADDRFDIILEHRRAATGETETGKLLYAGLGRSGGKDLRLMQWTQDGATQWFEASGVGKSRGALQRPVPGMVSSSFGMRRHPILGFSRMHKGMDFRAGYGTPILAATDGRVTAASWHGGYGRQVRIAHQSGLATSYSHMSRFAVAPGQSVRQGEVIGYVGSTGLSTGPHLHYELMRNGVPINPASVQFVMRAQLSGADLAGFKSRLRQLLAVPAGAQAAAIKAAKLIDESNTG
jgi:murein DD-endopeptidase MepM/ murein hydrolase activator NlpD